MFVNELVKRFFCKTLADDSKVTKYYIAYINPRLEAAFSPYKPWASFS